MTQSKLPPGLRELVNAATEVHVKHGLKGGDESSGKRKEVREGPEWERLRSALIECRRSGYEAENYDMGSA